MTNHEIRRNDERGVTTVLRLAWDSEGRESLACIVLRKRSWCRACPLL